VLRQGEIVALAARPGLELKATPQPRADPLSDANWLGWAVLAVAATALAPIAALAVVAVGLASVLAAEHHPSGALFSVCLVLGGAVVGRAGLRLGGWWGRSLVAVAVLGGAVAAVLAQPAARFSWLPEHLGRPGWGGVWMVALAWTVMGWPGLGGARISLGRRLAVASLLGLAALVLTLLRLPVDLERAADPARGVVLPRTPLVLGEMLPAPKEITRIDDLTARLAEQWGLSEWSTPSEVRLVGGDGFELSRWGDLGPAGDSVRTVRTWMLDEERMLELELRVATVPWGWLTDWETGLALDEARAASVPFVVFTRSGEIEATIHPEFRDLEPATAGELFHGNGGWVRVGVGGGHRLARVWRRDSWLVAAVANHPGAIDWLVRSAIAILWALLGTVLASPGRWRRQELSTFGGRLRLLIAGGVVLPLLVLTLVLHQRFSAQEELIERQRGLEMMRSARYTTAYLGGEFEVDDDLARWLASGWGGEAVVWDGVVPLAVSRPDLLATGGLPQMPEAAAYPGYLLGRSEPIVVRNDQRLVAAGPVALRERLFLLHLYRSLARDDGSDLEAADWLLTGALLSAVLALVLTTRIERRVSASLRSLVALARKLRDGEPVGEIEPSRETDIAEVLAAVGNMNVEVQRREQSLRRQEEMLRVTLSTLQPAVVVLEADGSVRYSNPSADRLRSDFGPRFLEVVGSVVQSVADDGPAESSVQPTPGRDVTWRIGVARVPLPEGAQGVLVVVDDVTDLVRADRNRQLNQLARIVAHEVKNPLTPIRLWVQELEAAVARGEPDLASLMNDALAEMTIQVDRLRETASSFSNLVALEQWKPEEVDLAALIADIPSGGDVFERRGVRIDRRVASPSPPAILADRTWIHRAVSNLVQNSMEALDGKPGTITVRVGTEGGQVVLEVEDDGGGVPDELLAELFAPHFSTVSAGSGLGLALVQQVVVRCQGRVAAANGELGLKIRLEFPSAGR
jgi:signal transduction histidine kinase